MHEAMEENLDIEQIKKELNRLLEENRKLNKTLRNTFAPYAAWICPRCGAVYGPGVKECGYCNSNRGQFSSKLILEVK